MNELEGKFDDIETIPMFDMEPTPVAAPEPMSADRRRTARPPEVIEKGGHPPALAIPGVRRHPETVGESYSADDPKGRPLTCGTCVHREQVRGGANSYPKCMADDGRRVTGGPGSDVRAWWVACSKWEVKP